MILAILENASSVQTLLNNLSEADFDLNNISVMMKDNKLRKTLGVNAGPLKGVQPKSVMEALTRAGISEENAKVCDEAIVQGKILLVMKVADEYSPAAEEMFRDHSAQLVKG